MLISAFASRNNKKKVVFKSELKKNYFVRDSQRRLRSFLNSRTYMKMNKTKATPPIKVKENCVFSFNSTFNAATG